MKSILSYDSKFFQILDSLANTMLLNLLFLISCLPVITIGASTTALFSASRAVARKEPWARAFFAAFKTNFLRATLIWLLLFPGSLVMAWLSWVIWANKMGGYIPAFIVSALALILILSLMEMCLLFYSRFECSVGQLLKNGLYMLLAYPLRTLIIGVGNWFPVLAFFLMPDTFVRLTIAWAALYFGTAGTVSVWLMKKPFARLAENLLGIVEEDPIPDEELAKRG